MLRLGLDRYSSKWILEEIEVVNEQDSRWAIDQRIGWVKES
jgi:hypothetical protein